MLDLSEKEIFDLETERQIKALIRSRKREWNKLQKQQETTAKTARAKEALIDATARSKSVRKPTMSSRMASFLWSILI